MVSQEFMNILRKQSQPKTPTASSSATSSSSEGRPLNIQEDEEYLTIKEEKEDYDDTGQSAVEVITEHSDLEIKEKEDISNNWKPSLPQTIVNSDCNVEASPLHQDSIEDKNVIAFPLPKLPQQLEEEEKTLLKHSNKRIIKKKIIFDPSDISSLQKNRRKKSLHKLKTEVFCNSETDEHCMESPKLLSKIISDEVSVSSGKSSNDLKCKNCKYCGRYVKREDYMRLHYMKHTGETPYKCTYCPNAYRTRWRLTQHLRTHTKNLPYHCPYCNYRGNRSDYLSSHVRRIHHKELKQSLQQVREETISDNEGKKL